MPYRPDDNRFRDVLQEDYPEQRNIQEIQQGVKLAEDQRVGGIEPGVSPWYRASRWLSDTFGEPWEEETPQYRPMRFGETLKRAAFGTPEAREAHQETLGTMAKEYMEETVRQPERFIEGITTPQVRDRYGRVVDYQAPEGMPQTYGEAATSYGEVPEEMIDPDPITAETIAPGSIALSLLEPGPGGEARGLQEASFFFGAPELRTGVAKTLNAVRKATKPGGKLRRAWLSGSEKGVDLSSVAPEGTVGAFGYTGDPRVRQGRIKDLEDLEFLAENFQKDSDMYLESAQLSDVLGLSDVAEDEVKKAETYKYFAKRKAEQIKKHKADVAKRTRRRGSYREKWKQDPYTASLAVAEGADLKTTGHELVHFLDRNMFPGEQNRARDAISSPRLTQHLTEKYKNEEWASKPTEHLAWYLEQHLAGDTLPDGSFVGPSGTVVSSEQAQKLAEELEIDDFAALRGILQE